MLRAGRHRARAIRSCVSGLLVLFAVWTIQAAIAAPPDQVDVLIAFKRPPGAAEHALVRGAGGTVRGTYSIVPAIAASVPSTAIQGLQHNPNVERIELDTEVQALHLTDADTAEVANSWGVDRLDANLVWGSTTGAGVGVAICDTGSGPHTDLPAATGRYDCLSGSVVAGGNDGNGHGTHCAGIALARQNNSQVVGVAPGAALFSYQVLNSSGSGSFSSVIAALNHIVSYNASAATPKIRVASFSLGSSANPGLTVQQAFDNAYNAGLLIVAAAGNSGNFLGWGNNVLYPARYSSVVAVAATSNTDQRASFSSTGPAVALSAPGVSIQSTWLNNGLRTASGTSMATPHVAGAAALLFGANPGWTNQQVRNQLNATAYNLGTAGKDNLYGYGLVNPEKAITGSNAHFPL